MHLPHGAPGAILLIASQIVFLIPAWRIARKLGFPGWTSLLLWVPIVNLIAIYWTAFTVTPIERRLASATENGEL